MWMDGDDRRMQIDPYPVWQGYKVSTAPPPRTSTIKHRIGC